MLCETMLACRKTNILYIFPMWTVVVLHLCVLCAAESVPTSGNSVSERCPPCAVLHSPASSWTLMPVLPLWSQTSQIQSSSFPAAFPFFPRIIVFSKDVHLL